MGGPAEERISTSVPPHSDPPVDFTGIDHSTPAARSSRKVQWPQDVEEHVAVPNASADGPMDEIPEEEKESANSIRDFRIDDIPERDERIDEYEDRPKAPVFVPEGEREGLPAATDEAERARGIISTYSTGMRAMWSRSAHRRRAKRREDTDDGHERDASTTATSTSGDAETADSGTVPLNVGVLTALMALQQDEAELAQSLPNSAASTPAPSTPGSPTASETDVHAPLDDLSDDEYERERFIAKLRAKRATKNSLHATSTAVSQAGKTAASAGFRFATGGHFRPVSGHDRSRNLSASDRAHSTSTLASLVEESPSRSRASAPSNHSSPRGLSPNRSLRDLPQEVSTLPKRSRSSATLATHHRSRSSTSLGMELNQERRRPASTTSHKPASRASSPSPPPSPGLYVPYQPRFTTELSKHVRKLGDRLGLELETERTRPLAARSGGGVFAGLIASTAGLAGVATPSGSSLAPLATRSGFHVARASETRPAESPKSARQTSPVQSPPKSPSPELSPSIERSSGIASRGPYNSQSRAASRMSLHEMVKEEEERDLQEAGEGLQRSQSVGTFETAPATTKPPSYATSPLQSGMSAVEALSQRRARRKKGMFSLQVNDLPSMSDISRKTSPTSPTAGPFGASSPLNPNPGRSRNSAASPTTPTFRIFGPKTPRSPDGIASRKDYFAGAPTLAQIEKERAERRAERKAKEKQEREAKEREADLREWDKEKRRRRKQRLKELKARRVFITSHVAALLERQEFILKLARALMMFGAPSHRLEAQLQATGRVLELPNCHCVYLPGVMLINFADPASGTSDIKFLKQPAGLDFGKLRAAFWVYSKVVRDKMKVTEASSRLDELMVAPPKYALWQSVLIGGLASAAIIPSAFYGSFIDMLAVVPLGGLLVVVQVLLARNDLYSSLFEIAIACINCLIAGGLAYSNEFCFYSVAAGSIVLILPGFIVLSGSLELANRSIISGAVRVTYSILYSLFLGFGLSLGSEIYTRGANETIRNSQDYTCQALRTGAPWYRATVPQWYYFLTIPTFLLCMALKNGQPLFRRDTLAMVVIGGAGFSANFFSGRAFPNAPAVTSAFGAFIVGVLGNLWSKATRESAFVVMIVGIFVQLPSGLANGGLLASAIQGSSGNSDAFSSSVNAAAGIVRTVVGMAVGLFTSAALINLVSRRGVRRGANLATF
ncbi:uncharacterized protein JCM15063_004781 [Sporobolomyces koalae]|uniref:uncharacterized protein n=1 Tax=Sporobolomyces koalae TaxID=500713 RepID=UPI00316EAE71